MKVGIVHTAYLHKGGEDGVVANDIKYLKERSVEVSTLYFKNPVSKIKQVTNLLVSAFNYSSAHKINKWIDAEQPDVIHIHNWHYSASPSVIYAASKKGIPVVHTLHNYRLVCPSALLLHNNKLFLNSIHAAFPWRAVRNRVYHNSFLQTFLLASAVWLNKKLGTWKKVDRYIALTESAKNIFLNSSLNLNKNQVTVKPNCIPDVTVAQTKRDDNFLFVGRLSEEKGVLLLLNAFAKSKYQITFIGSGSLLETAKEFERKHNNIIVAGLKDHAYIMDALSKCTALIVPSLWYEGSPLTIIEAFACSTPIIASKLGAMESMITNNYNGLHFEPGNEEALTGTLAAWQSLSEADKKNFSNNARSAYLKDYTPEKNTEELIKIYKSVIHGKEELV